MNILKRTNAVESMIIVHFRIRAMMGKEMVLNGTVSCQQYLIVNVIKCKSRFNIQVIFLKILTKNTLFRFWNCLSAEPLKETYSLVIRSIFFVGLNLKCFAYLPCNEDENEDEDAFFGSGLRRIGDCSNGIKVRAFQSIQEYDLFMQNFSSKLEVVNILRNSSELKNEDKHNATCYRNFKYLINDMIDSFIFNNNITLENSENQNKEIDLLNKKIDQVMERVDETSNSMNKVVFAIIIMCFSLIVFVIVIILIKRNSKKRKAKQPVRI